MFALFLVDHGCNAVVMLVVVVSVGAYFSLLGNAQFFEKAIKK